MPAVRLAARVALLVALAAPAAAETLTQADLLYRMLDLDRLTRPAPAGEHALLFSSFDRSALKVEDGRYVNWDANNDRGQFLERREDGWCVMAALEGPGVVNRIWIDEPAGRVQILLDGKATIDAPLADLFNGRVEPLGAPLCYETAPGRGANCRFPFGFAESCEIRVRGFEGAYQIDVTALPAGTKVQPYRPDLDDNAAAALEEVVKALRDGLSEKRILGTGGRTRSEGTQESVKPGKTLRWDLQDAGTIRALLVSTTDRTEPRALYALHNCILRIYWDGRNTPDVEMPLIAFFGSGFERIRYSGLAAGTDYLTEMSPDQLNEGWFMYSYFPMPYARGGRIEIENRNTIPIGLLLWLRIAPGEPPADALRFRGRFRSEDPCASFDYPILETSGRGRLVGCLLNVDCPRQQWWGEGDHKVWLDGVRTPAMLGTDTAGFFGNVRGLKRSTSPLQGATLVAPYGKNSLYRQMIADSIPFQRGIRFTIENHQPDQADDVYYSSVALWYGEPGVPASADALDASDLRLPGLRIPGAVEVEGNIEGKDWGSVLRQKYAGMVELSGEAAARLKADTPVEVRIPAPAPGEYILSLRVHPRRSFETVAVAAADGTAIGTVTYARRPDGIYEVGRVKVDGDLRVTVRCSRATVLDCWIFRPVQP